jgi:hypothetical protein
MLYNKIEKKKLVMQKDLEEKIAIKKIRIKFEKKREDNFLLKG